MSFKNKIKIGFREFDLVYADGLRNNDGAALYGEIRYDTMEIKINTEHDSNQQKSTIIHEVLHGIADYNGIELNENQTVGLGSNLYEFMKNNPKLIEHIMENE
jgi:hypothetical protein